MQKAIFIAALLAAVASCQSLTEVLTAQKASLSTLTTLLSEQPAIVKTLSSANNITILAPSNQAFTTFLNTPAGATAAGIPTEVASLLTYHVLAGLYPASSFTMKPQFIPTLLTDTAHSNVTGGQRVEARVNGCNVEITSGLLSKSVVTVADIKFTGGVIHVIDHVLTIPAADSTTAVAAGLSSLAGALTKAGLVSTVDGLKDVTIFAPNNAAFAAIASTAATLTVAQLASVLEYHVVAGTVGYSSLLSNTTLKTVNGKSLTITLSGGNVLVNSATVVLADVLVANGVVHVIDSVLLPPA